MTNNAPIELSIAIPAYEEAANLQILLPKLHEVASRLTPYYEILIIDAQEPRDDTPAICAQNNTPCIARTGGTQYGAAIRTALKTVKGRYVVIMDADGSHAPTFIPKLWDFRKDYDLVIASRYVEGGKTENPYILIFLSLVVNVVFRLVLNLDCRDVSNSFRLYRGDSLRALTLECEHFDVVEEILVKLNSTDNTFKIKEVAFTFEKRKKGKTKRNLVIFALGYLGTLCKLYRMKRKAHSVA